MEAAAAGGPAPEAIGSLLEQVGEPAGAAPELTPIPGGASRQTWLVDTGERRYVVRRDPPGAEAPVPQAVEFALIQAAAGAGVPVPEALAYERDGGRLGTAGILMRHVDGDSVAPRLLRHPQYDRARELLPAQLGAALARIHSLDPGALPDELARPGGDPALAAVELWERELDRVGEPLPVLELGLRWLRTERPPPAGPALVHGDFRLGNFIVDDGGLAAVIDWELAHVGDPAEDIGWLCIRSWRFGNDDRPVAGLGPLEAFLAAYESAGGRRPDPERLRYWQAFGNLKWGVVCARQARDHLTGVRRSHELASLGRRICEPEWDLLELIG